MQHAVDVDVDTTYAYKEKNTHRCKSGKNFVRSPRCSLKAPFFRFTFKSLSMYLIFLHCFLKQYFYSAVMCTHKFDVLLSNTSSFTHSFLNNTIAIFLFNKTVLKGSHNVDTWHYHFIENRKTSGELIKSVELVNSGIRQIMKINFMIPYQRLLDCGDCLERFYPVQE